MFEPSNHQFTAREEEVIKLVAKGHTNAQIALKLRISPKTVATYLSRIYTKLRVGNRPTAVSVYLLDSKAYPKTEK